MSTQARLDKLRKRKAKIEEQLSALEAKEKEKARKEDTRLKVLIGAGMLADANINPETESFIKAVLARASTTKRDREFLQLKGWLEEKNSDGLKDAD